MRGCQSRKWSKKVKMMRKYGWTTRS
uniref:Uncharacterized protein n=1 Tax=Anguilla anguilla TaxID=7936 RepID=A0A0E9XEV1_ANGAN